MTPSPPTMRARMRGGPEGLEIVIPARRSLGAVLFLGIWLAGWAMGLVDAVSRLRRDPISDPALLAWFVLWAAAGAGAVCAWLWMLIGRERILMGTSTLSIRREILGFGLTRRYGLGQIRNLRVEVRPPNPRDLGATLRAFGFTGGAIAFEHQGATVRFGASIDGTEAVMLVDRMKQRYAFPEFPPAP